MTDEHIINVIDDTINLLKRQKADIEYWKNKYLNLWCEPNSDIQKIKAEVIKRFAERLKAVSHPYADTQMVFVLQIDNLVAEMTEEKANG